MSREIDNPMYSFLFENESPAHKAKLRPSGRRKSFGCSRADPSGSRRQPTSTPKECPRSWWLTWTLRSPSRELYRLRKFADLKPKKSSVSPKFHCSQRDRLEDIIRHLTPERCRIGDAMIFCIEHVEAADEICECIAESLSNPETLVSTWCRTSCTTALSRCPTPASSGRRKLMRGPQKSRRS